MLILERTINSSNSDRKQRTIMNGISAELSGFKSALSTPEVPSETKRMAIELRQRLSNEFETRYNMRRAAMLERRRQRLAQPRTRRQGRNNQSTNRVLWTRDVVCLPPEFCSVCIDEHEDMVQIRCSHMFCRTCIMRSLQSDLTCPLCRQPVLG